MTDASHLLRGCQSSPSPIGSQSDSITGRVGVWLKFHRLKRSDTEASGIDAPRASLAWVCHHQALRQFCHISLAGSGTSFKTTGKPSGSCGKPLDCARPQNQRPVLQGKRRSTTKSSRIGQDHKLHSQLLRDWCQTHRAEKRQRLNKSQLISLQSIGD